MKAWQQLFAQALWDQGWGEGGERATLQAQKGRNPHPQSRRDQAWWWTTWSIPKLDSLESIGSLKRPRTRRKNFRQSIRASSTPYSQSFSVAMVTDRSGRRVGGRSLLRHAVPRQTSSRRCALKGPKDAYVVAASSTPPVATSSTLICW